jgi:hypothetical protein
MSLTLNNGTWIKYPVVYVNSKLTEVTKLFESNDDYCNTLNVLMKSGRYAPRIVIHGFEDVINMYYIIMDYAGISLSELRITPEFQSVYMKAAELGREYVNYLHDRDLAHGDLFEDGRLHLGNTMYNKLTGVITFIDPRITTDVMREITNSLSPAPPTPMKVRRACPRVSNMSSRELF